MEETEHTAHNTAISATVQVLQTDPRVHALLCVWTGHLTRPDPVPTQGNDHNDAESTGLVIRWCKPRGVRGAFHCLCALGFLSRSPTLLPCVHTQSPAHEPRHQVLSQRGAQVLQPMTL